MAARAHPHAIVSFVKPFPEPADIAFSLAQSFIRTIVEESDYLVSVDMDQFRSHHSTFEMNPIEYTGSFKIFPVSVLKTKMLSSIFINMATNSRLRL
jgi:hypothetical protein